MIIAENLRVGDVFIDPLTDLTHKVEEIDTRYNRMVFVNPGNKGVLLFKHETVEFGGEIE